MHHFAMCTRQALQHADMDELGNHSGQQIRVPLFKLLHETNIQQRRQGSLHALPADKPIAC